jgi:hypothetical protein
MSEKCYLENGENKCDCSCEKENWDYDYNRVRLCKKCNHEGTTIIE